MPDGQQPGKAIPPKGSPLALDDATGQCTYVPPPAADCTWSHRPEGQLWYKAPINPGGLPHLKPSLLAVLPAFF